MKFADFVESLTGELAEQPMDVLWYDYQRLVEVYVDDESAKYASLFSDMKHQPGFDMRRAVEILIESRMTQSVMVSHFGEEWFDSVFETTARIKNIRDFFYPEADTEELDTLSRHRKTEVARRIQQFQFADWFPSLCKKVRVEALSSLSFEMDVALYLMHLPPNVERREPIGVKGEDFDINFWIEKPPLCVEVKTKSDDTDFTFETVEKTISDASKQMPECGGYLFIRIPPMWTGPNFIDTYKSYLQRTFAKQTLPNSKRGRVSVVFTAIDEVVGDPGSMKVSRQWHLYRNPNCADSLWQIAEDLDRLNTAGFDMMAPVAPF